jgi:hypothetical protein
VAVELFAGIPVGDFAAALRWYERLLDPDGNEVGFGGGPAQPKRPEM